MQNVVKLSLIIQCYPYQSSLFNFIRDASLRAILTILPFFHLYTNTWTRSGPFCWNKNSLATVLEYIIFQFCSNTKQISYLYKIQKKLCKPHCCLSNQLLSKLYCFFAWQMLFKVATFLFFCSYFSPNRQLWMGVIILTFLSFSRVNGSFLITDIILSFPLQFYKIAELQPLWISD